MLSGMTVGLHEVINASILIPGQYKVVLLDAVESSVLLMTDSQLEKGLSEISPKSPSLQVLRFSG